MTSKNKLKYIVIVIIFILAGFAMADSLVFFNPKPYTKVSKGSHAHYVPDNRDPDVPITRFPKRPPRAGEKITPKGQIIKK
jgi:hypothetical protein